MFNIPALGKLKQTKVSNEALLAEIHELRRDMAGLHATLMATFHDECCPKMHKISKELGDRMIEKLQAEDKARRHTLGEL